MLNSLRSRLILLVILSILPGMVLVLVIANEQRARAVQEVQSTNLSFMRLVTSNQRQMVQNTRSLMVTLAQIPDIRNRNIEDCNVLLAQILKNAMGYKGFSVNDLDGNILCSAPKTNRPTSVANRDFFQQARKQNAFAVGGFQLGSVTGEGNLTFGFPITDSRGEVSAILGAGIDVAWLNNTLSQLQLPDSYVVNIIDRSGTLITRWPFPEKFVGTKPLDSVLIQHMLNGTIRNSTTTEALKGVDGVERLYTYSFIGEPANPDLMITVGVSTDAAFSQINQTLARNLIALTATALLGILVALVVSNNIVIKPLAQLTQTAQKLRNGDLSARTGIVRSRDEIDQLAHNFDEMADRLQTQTLQLTTAERQQRILAEVGTIFGSPLDFAQRIEQVVNLLIQNLADWGMVNVFESDQTIKQLVLAHKDPAKVPLARELVTNYPANNNPAAVRDWLLQEQKSAFFPYISPEEVLKGAQDDRHTYLIETVGIAGFMIVPLMTQGKVLGEVTLVRGPATPSFTSNDLALVEELARRAAVALDHALLFQMTQSLNQTLEQQVVQKTAQLRESVQRLRTSREQLRELAVKQRELIEEEQTRISREVHDNLGQNLTGLKMDLSRLQRLVGPEITSRPNIARHLATMNTLIDNTVQTVRSIARQMRPSILDDLGLAPAIEWYCNDIQARTNIAVTFERQNAQDAILPNVATEAYRILQEAVTNVIRHAHATQITVTLENNETHLCLSIEDNGVGMSGEQQSRAKSLGVLGMQERALKLGGTLKLHSEMGQGTHVIVELPLRPGEAPSVPAQDF